MDLTKIDKAKMYAIALPNDISAERFEVVENGKLWRGWTGTVYGVRVECLKAANRAARWAYR